jgi:hypothetical protein
MSLMRVKSASAEERTVSRKPRWSGLSSVSRVRSVIPMMPFIGVRISWLMFARNSLLARLALSAALRAASSSSARRARRVALVRPLQYSSWRCLPSRVRKPR